MKGLVYYNGELAGVIEKNDVNGRYTFRYDDDYFLNKDTPSISLTFPKSQQTYHSASLFPFFYGLLSEGINKEIQCSLYKIDENDDFTRLLLTSRYDTIGAITVKPETDEMLRLF
jgi:HipA-like protein